MARPYAPTPATRAAAPAPPPPSVNRLAIVLPAVGLLVVATIVFVFVALPIILRSRCIRIGAERGVTLTLDHVAIGLGEVRLVRVAFSLNGVPQIAASADDAEVILSGLT